MFKLFIWKNALSAWYTVKSSWIEIILYMGLISCLAKNHCQPSTTTPPYLDSDTTDNNVILCYTPNNDAFLSHLMEEVRMNYGLPPDKLLSFDNEKDMLTFMYTHIAERSFAVTFYKYKDLRNLTYTINVGHQFIFPRTFSLNEKYEGLDRDDYVSSGVLNLKNMIDSKFRELSERKDPSTLLQSHVRAEARYSSSKPAEPCDTNQDDITTFGLIFLIILKKLLISLVLVPLVQEKESGIKDFLALSTPCTILDDLAFFVNRFLLTFLFIALSMLFTTPYHPLGEITYTHVFGLFTLYLLSDVAYTFMVSTFCDSVFYAKVGGILFHYIPFVLVSVTESALHKYSFMTGGNLFYEGIEMFHKFSVNARKLKSGIEEGTSLKGLYAGLVLQSFIYMLLYFYLYAVIPGKGRKRKPFYFIVQPSFYFGKKEKHVTWPDENSYNKQGIKIINLTKIFREGCRNQKVVVDDVNVTIDSNCITTFIGTNDGGKTTLFNMILGYVNQTAGDIIIDGNKNPDKKYRNTIGFCPKHNILLPYLTSIQHLTFFGCLKGADFTNAQAYGATLLKGLKLFDKSTLSIEKLTPAMKRKLSLGIALCGYTKIIILDKPTSGLDIVSRREIWNLLLELKYSKTILVATNDMEEAEVLSDNIIFMSNGKLLQNSSSLEMKHLYGCDYILKLDIEENFNIQETMSLIHEFVPKAKVNTYSDTSIYIRIPYSYKSVYIDLLTKLEELTNELKISNISITNHFFDDVFVNSTKVYDDEPEHSMAHEFLQNKRQYNTIVDVSTSLENITKGISPRELFAIFYKKLVYIRREPFLSLFLFLIPLVAIAIAFSTINSHEVNDPQPVCNINGSKIFIKTSETFENLQDIIIDDIRERDGIPILISEHHVIETILLRLQYDNITHFNERVFGALEFHNDTNGWVIRVLHVGSAQNCKNIMVKIINDAISKTQEVVAEEIHIQVSDISGKSDVNVTPRILEYYSSVVPVGWFLYILFYVTLPYKETITRFKLVQNISPLRYWIAFTLADICLHTIICFFAFVVQKMFDNIYNGSEETTFMLSFMFYGFGYFPILYLLAGIVKALSTIISCLVISLIVSAVVNIFTTGGPLNIVPDFGLKHQLRLINENYFIRHQNQIINAMHAHNIMDIDTIEEHKTFGQTTAWYYGSMTVALFTFSAILIFIREKHFIFVPSCRKPIDQTLTSEGDDVLSEKKMVAELIKEQKQKEYALLVNKMDKPYIRTDTVAVPSISFAVRPGECFGVVGLNDSGKTQTMHLLTGNLKITSGDVYIYLINIRNNLNMFKQLTGYGMQVNSLNEFMTPNEILKYISLLRGLSDNEIPRIIMDWMQELDFTKYRNTQIMDCSDVVKRKLCLTIAMIGKPAVIFLDDPTNGVDPKSRILMWKCIKKVQKEHKAIILSTNNMDECEYLCSRIAILNRGYMHTIGTLRQLKANLEYGCILTIKMRNDHLPADINVLVASLPTLFGGYIKYRTRRLVRYLVCEQPIIWSSVFDRMQQLSKDHENVIEECYVKEATIEAILLNIPIIPTIAEV